MKTIFKKTAVSVISMLLLLTNIIAFAAGNEVEVTIPEFGVTIGGEEIDNEHNEFPLIVYNDITYFPMTWNFSRSLGLSSDWNSKTGLSIAQSDDVEELIQDKSVTNDLSKTYTALVADFGIDLNGNTINNSEEEYPILLFRDITYFPLTWKFTVDEFGWESGWDDSKGLSIVNNNIQTTINIDESNNNTTDVSNINNSSVVVNNNNVDNSVNDSNNVYNDHSTNVTNNIDNSIDVTTGETLDKIMEEINKLKDSGVISGNLVVSFEIKDKETDEVIENAAIYANNMPVALTDEMGSADVDVYMYAQYTFEIRHDDYETLSYMNGYTESEVVVQRLDKKVEVEEAVEEVVMIDEETFELVVVDELDVEFSDIESFSGHSFMDEGFEVNSLMAGTDDDFIYIKIEYVSPINSDSVGMRYGGDADELNSYKHEDDSIVEGENIFIFKILKETITSFPNDVYLEIGDENALPIFLPELLQVIND